ncbi:MAG: hypothetical protein KAR05_10615 [Candidatus Omnitrophica bacterium]|nr:hypothetical protein [Candidatus Omnitrophota bacterium]
MNNLYSVKGRRLSMVALIVLVGCMSLMLSGCEPLRKKFVRKKKKGREKEVLPILEPIDYVAKKESSPEIYRKYYAMRKVWHKDLLMALEEGGRDKHVLYVIDKEIMLLVDMKNLLQEAKQKGIEAQIQKLRKIEADLNRPEAFRNQDAMLKNLIRIDRDIRNDFKPDVVINDLES